MIQHRRKDPEELDPHKWNNNPPLGWIRQSRITSESNTVSLWWTKITWDHRGGMRWVHWRSLNSREWLLIGLNAGWMDRSIKPVKMSKNGGDLLHFLQQEVVLFMALGPLEVSENKDLGICLLHGKNNCKGQGQDKDKSGREKTQGITFCFPTTGH